MPDTTRQQLEQLKLDLCEKIDAIISTLPKDDTFLQDLQKPVPNKLEAMDKAAATGGGVPDLSDVEPLVEAVQERFDLIPEGKKEMTPATWKRCLKAVIVGGWDSSKVTTTKGIDDYHFSKKQISTLENLEGLRATMLDGSMDLNAAVSQPYVGEVEKEVLTEWALAENL